MTIEVEEAWGSGDASIGVDASAELPYYAFCLDGEGEVEAHAAVVAQAPLIYRSIPARGSRIRRLTQTVYEVTCLYNLDQKQTQQSDPATSSFNTSLSFNLVGGTQHITTALDTKSYAVGPPVDVKNVIGLDLKTGQVRGVDVFAPVMDYSYATQFAKSVVTNDYIDQLHDLTGTVNAATFYRRPAGSVLFKGARGSRKGQDLWEVSFEFAYSKNKTNQTINGINFNKKGWEYLDVMYKEDSSQLIGGKAIQVPTQVNIHKVFEDGDFSKLLIGG